jgi:hypothetical protein
MKKIAMFAAIGGLALVSAAPPKHVSSSGTGGESSGGYPACSRTITDRCIQLYERGVATPANLALNERLGMNTPGRGMAAMIAMGGPYEPYDPSVDYDAGDDDGGYAAYDENALTADDGAGEEGEYPPCSGPDDDRCIQL